MTFSYRSIVIFVPFALLALACTTPAFAGPVTELEANGTALNNTIATAQGITSTNFTLNVNPNVFGNVPTATVTGLNGGGDVDFFSFQTGVGTGYFDIDNSPFTFDSVLSLFDSAGTLIAFSDDTIPVDPGSESRLDAFLGTYQFTQAGTYYIAVSEFDNYPSAFFEPMAVFTDLTRPDGAIDGSAVRNAPPGDSSFLTNSTQVGSAYTLHISLSNPANLTAAPEPGSVALALMAGVPVVGIIRRRYKVR